METVLSRRKKYFTYFISGNSLSFGARKLPTCIQIRKLETTKYSLTRDVTVCSPSIFHVPRYLSMCTVLLAFLVQPQNWWSVLSIDRTHTRKPFCTCYLSHAWKVIFSRKGLVHRIFFFQSFVYVYECHLWIMRYMSIAYRRRWLRRPEGRPKRKIGFVGFLRVGCQFRCFFENRPSLCCILF